MHINYDDNLDEKYFKDRNAITTQKELENLQSKWGDVFPEIIGNVDIEKFIKVRENKELQDELVKNNEALYLNLLLPNSLLRLIILAKIYGVTTGVAYLQFKKENIK